MKMEPETCIWNVYDNDSRAILGIGLCVIGLISLILNCWMLVTFLKTSLSNDRSYLPLLNLNVASTTRCMLGGFFFSGISAVSHRWMFGETYCKLFGFLRQFIGAYQMEALTHMCIERYVVAKYIKYGWEMPRSQYTLFTALCWLFSITYSFPQLIGWGSYSWDYTCTAYSMDLILPGDLWRKSFVVLILLLGSVKPIMFMVSMLTWAAQLELQCYSEKDHRRHILLNKSTAVITRCTMWCWTPAAVTTAWVVLTQLVHGIIVQPNTLLAALASLSNEAAPAVMVVAAFLSNDHLRTAMMSLIGDALPKKIA